MGYFRQLYRLQVLSPKGLSLLFGSVLQHRMNLLAIVRQRSKLHPEMLAICDTEHRVTYRELYDLCCRKSAELSKMVDENAPKKVAFLGNNKLLSVVYLIACSARGFDIHFVNPDLPRDAIGTLLEKLNCPILLVDPVYSEKAPENATPYFFTPVDETMAIKTKDRRMGKLIVLTGGSSGNFKRAVRKSSIRQFLAPFRALVQSLELDQHSSVFVGPPLYHGFGLASLIMSLSLGKSVYLQPGFRTSEAHALLKEEGIEVFIAVPTMIDRLVRFSEEQLPELSCIVSGGAQLSEQTLESVQKVYGEVCFNLYGTSESGFVSLASPSDLRMFPRTVGKPIKGVRVRLNFSQENESILEFRNAWAMSGQRQQWVSTGDIATINEANYIFISGRGDDMIVSGGENVHLNAVSDKIKALEDVLDAVCLPIHDDAFGQRIALFVVLSKSTDSETLKETLKQHLARFEMPAEIYILPEIPLNSVGKISRKSLYNVRLSAG